jgi:hypothetical protein
LGPKSPEEIVKGISEKLSLSNKGKTSTIVYNCKDRNVVGISFDSLKLYQDIGFEFTKKNEVDIPFISFDRIYATVGGGLLLSWGIKDIYSASVVSKSKGKFLLGILGAMSGYSLGYYIFRQKNIDCTSKDVEIFFSNRDNLLYIKKCIISQIMLKDVLALRISKKNEVACFSLGKMHLINYSPYIENNKEDLNDLFDPNGIDITFITQKCKSDAIFYKKLLRIESSYYTSFKKLRDNKLQEFTSEDIRNIIAHIAFIKSEVAEYAGVENSYGIAYEVKNISELTDTEEQHLK